MVYLNRLHPAWIESEQRTILSYLPPRRPATIAPTATVPQSSPLTDPSRVARYAVDHSRW